MVQDDEPVGLEGVRVVFDDERVVSDAGITLVATVAQRLGVQALARDLVRLRRDRPRGSAAAWTRGAVKGRHRYMSGAAYDRIGRGYASSSTRPTTLRSRSCVARWRHCRAVA